jgi:hypothetical protein
MNDMTPITVRLTPDRAKALLEEAGADNVHVKARTSGKMWAFFSYLGEGCVWGLRVGALERNFARDVATELTPPTKVLAAAR